MPILIVEDDPTIRDMIGLLLTTGFDGVFSAESDVKALEALAVGKPKAQAVVAPDVILMDIMMPEMDGIETVARIRMDPDLADVPIVMVTTMKDIEHLKQAFIAGATDYMTKPIRTEELLARVRVAYRLKKESDRRKAREAQLTALALHTTAPDTGKLTAPDRISGLFGEAVLLGKLGWALARKEKDGLLAVLSLDAWDEYRTRYGDSRTEAAMADIAAALTRQPAQLGDQWVQLSPSRFGIFCPHIKTDEVKRCVRQWQAVIRGLKIKHGFSQAGPYATASAGVVPLAHWPGSRADLLAEALALAEQVQRSGGDAHLIYSPPGKG